MSKVQNVVIFGAKGRTGQLIARMATAAGYNVTVLVPNPSLLPKDLKVAKVIAGDVLKFRDVSAAMQGQDAVIISFGTSTAPSSEQMMSEGTANVLEAMNDKGLRKVIVRMSAFNMTADHNRMYKKLLDSGLDYVNVMPANIIDTQPLTDNVKCSDNLVRGMTISRSDFASFMVKLLSLSDWDKKTVGVWGVYTA